MRRQTIYSSGSVSLTNAAQDLTEKPIPNYGDLYALEVILKVTATGTLSTAKTIDRIVKSLNIRDKNLKPIYQNIKGTDLRLLEHKFGRLGINTATSVAVDATVVTRKWFVRCYVDSTDLSGTIGATLDSYAVLAASGCTGGTVSLQIDALYLDGCVDHTTRYSAVDMTLVSGSATFGPSVPKQAVITGVAIAVGTESNFVDITISRDGGTELQSLTADDIIAQETQELVSGHVTNEFKIPVSNFVAQDKTVFNITGAGSDTAHVIFELTL